MLLLLPMLLLLLQANRKSRGRSRSAQREITKRIASDLRPIIELYKFCIFCLSNYHTFVEFWNVRCKSWKIKNLSLIAFYENVVLRITKTIHPFQSIPRNYLPAIRLVLAHRAPCHIDFDIRFREFSLLVSQCGCWPYVRMLQLQPLASSSLSIKNRKQR